MRKKLRVLVEEAPPPALYRVQFLPAAKAEWDKLDGSVQLQFTKVLAKRIASPRNPKAALASMPDCYKIKLRDVGYRLVYCVKEDALVLLTIAVGKRDKNAVYEAASGRLKVALQAAANKFARSSKPKI